jgi:hypothetical protein
VVVKHFGDAFLVHVKNSVQKSTLWAAIAPSVDDWALIVHQWLKEDSGNITFLKVG